MSSDRTALLAAVLASPHDDAPRLIYADCLEETGIEADVARAKFIRAEIAAEAFPAHDPRREEFETTAAGLFNRWGNHWNQSLPEWVTRRILTFYKRGFIFHIKGQFDYIDANFGRIAALMPVGAVSVTDAVRAERRVGSHVWNQITELAIGLRFDDDNQIPNEHFFNTVLHLSKLQRLQINRLDGGDRLHNLIRMLLNSRCLLTLREMDLSEIGLTDADAAYLAAARGLERITRLNVARNSCITPHGELLLRARFGDGLEI